MKELSTSRLTCADCASSLEVHLRWTLLSASDGGYGHRWLCEPCYQRRERMAAARIARLDQLYPREQKGPG